MADPFTPDRFYLKPQSGGLWISADGGATWSKKGVAPGGTGNLAVNEIVPGDLWVPSTYQDLIPATGLYHSTDDGATWNKVPGPARATGVALGKGCGQPGAAPYTVFFYGEMTGDRQPGMFRSTDAGQAWQRISFYPCGLFCQTPTRHWSLAASWDEFGLVAMNTGGQGWVYGKPE